MTILPCPGAASISSSRWSIGGETLDRGYADYWSYRDHLGPLGVKRIRLQAGWATCEQQPGVYEFDWLERIVDDALGQGVQPWLELSYGNPVYENGGTRFLAGGIPLGEEAQSAWDAWVKALVMHFRDRVREWAVWNEPDISRFFKLDDYAAFYLRTARVVRSAQPSAYLVGMNIANAKRAWFVHGVLSELKEADALDLIDAVSFHAYRVRPEDVQPLVEEIRETVDRYRPGLDLWQGEAGAPSGDSHKRGGAMTEHDWNETSQAKWDLRRMANDLQQDLKVCNIFQISDMWYEGGEDPQSGWNSKGLLETNQDRQVVKIRRAWHAVQNFAHMLAEEILLRPDVQVQVEAPYGMGYACEREGAVAILYWKAEGMPSGTDVRSRTRIILSGHVFEDPRLLDPLNGTVEPVDVSREVPIHDAPLLIVDKKWLE